jgi:hypothetical protein
MGGMLWPYRNSFDVDAWPTSGLLNGGCDVKMYLSGFNHVEFIA